MRLKAKGALIYLDISYANWSAAQSNSYIVIAATIIRFRLYNAKLTSLFLDASLGTAYLTNTMSVNRNQSNSFSSQALARFGLLFGKINTGV